MQHAGVLVSFPLNGKVKFRQCCVSPKPVFPGSTHSVVSVNGGAFEIVKSTTCHCH